MVETYGLGGPLSTLPPLVFPWGKCSLEVNTGIEGSSKKSLGTEFGSVHFEKFGFVSVWPRASLSAPSWEGCRATLKTLLLRSALPAGGCRSSSWAGASGSCVPGAGFWGCVVLFPFMVAPTR